MAGEQKRFGLIVDYIGITRNLGEALAAYRDEDVENAMQDLEVERDARCKGRTASVLEGPGGPVPHLSQPLFFPWTWPSPALSLSTVAPSQTGKRRRSERFPSPSPYRRPAGAAILPLNELLVH